MKKLEKKETIIAIVILLSILFGHRTEAAGTHYIEPHFGMNSGQMAIGFDYEYKFKKNSGFGGYFIFSSEDDDDLIAGLMGFGANYKLHAELKDVEIYLAPGFGFAQIELSDEDESFFGPSLKIGGLIKVSEQVALGLEYFTLYNWSSSELPFPFLNQYDLALFKVRIGFN